MTSIRRAEACDWALWLLARAVLVAERDRAQTGDDDRLGDVAEHLEDLLGDLLGPGEDGVGHLVERGEQLLELRRELLHHGVVEQLEGDAGEGEALVVAVAPRGVEGVRGRLQALDDQAGRGQRTDGAADADVADGVGAADAVVSPSAYVSVRLVLAETRISGLSGTDTTLCCSTTCRPSGCTAAARGRP